MDSFMLQDEGVRDRIRQAEEFLDPSMSTAHPFDEVLFLLFIVELNSYLTVGLR
jgi:hypothetical protein